MANKTSLKDTINSLREAFEHEQNQAREAFEQKLSHLLVNVKKTVLHSLQEVQTTLDGLDKPVQLEILNDSEIKKAFTALGYKRKDTDGAASTGRGGKFNKNKDAIIAFLADGEKELEQVKAKFGVSKQSLGTWGKKLEDEKLIKIEKRGREKFWSKV